MTNMTEDQLREMLRGGAIIVIGVNNIEATAELMKSGVPGFMVPRDSALSLQLPNEDMAHCMVVLNHYLPKTISNPPSQAEANAWFQKLWSEVSMLGYNPSVSMMFSQSDSVMTFVLRWDDEVMASIPLTAVRDLERACLKYGGRTQ